MRNVTATLLFALAVGLALPGPALAREYSTGPVDITAKVAENGDMHVAEQRTFSFDGDFTFVFWSIPKEGSEGIENITVAQVDGATQQQEYTLTTDPNATETRPPGTYLVTDVGDAIEIRVFHRTTDTDATWMLQYDALRAAKRYADTGELYWKFIGPGWEVPVTDVRIEIAPPAPLTKADVQAWAHGPLTGNVAILDDGTVTLDVADVPAETFVEARVLYPAESLAAAPVIPEARRQSVLDEEGALADAANAQRTRARFQVWGAMGASIALSLGALAFAVWAFFKYGREHKTQFPGGYFREDPRPDLPPAVVGALWRFGKVADADVAATLMDLADKGVITMQPKLVSKPGFLGIGGSDTQSYELRLNEERTASLSAVDATLVDILFRHVSTTGTLDLEELKAYAKASPKAFSDRMTGWKAEASAAADGLGMFEVAGNSWQVGMWVLAVAVFGLTFFASTFAESFWPLLVGVPTAGIIAVVATFMTRRSKEGNELYAQYKGLHDFLRDFSRLNEVPPASVVLWNRFLVLAVVFGIAEEVIAQLRVKIPEVVENPGFQTTYWWVYAGAHGSSPVSSLQSGFASASQVASSAMSSSSGGGGGFSGGGGGGGGAG